MTSVFIKRVHRDGPHCTLLLKVPIGITFLAWSQQNFNYMFPVIQKSPSVLRGMLHICTEHIQDSFCVSVYVWEHEFLPFRSQDRQDRKGAQISKSGVMWSTSLAGLRAKSEQRYCVHDQPPTSAGADSQNYTQDIECAPSQACCVMETLPPY